MNGSQSSAGGSECRLYADVDQHAFAQIYVLDTEQASDRRLEVSGGRDDSSPLRRDVLSQLHRLMLQYNPCVQQFVTAARENLPQLAWRCSDDYLDNANGRFSGAAWVQARHRHTATCEQLCAHMIDKVSCSYGTLTPATTMIEG